MTSPFAPLKVSVALAPEAIVVLPLIVGDGNGFTVTDAVVAVTEHTPFIAVTVYTPAETVLVVMPEGFWLSEL